MLNKQIFISFFSMIIIGFTGFLAIPFLTRMLTPDEMGKIFLILALVGFMQIFDGFRPVITFVYNEKAYDETILLEIINKINFLYIISMVIFLFLTIYFFTDIKLIEIFLYIITFIFYSLTSVLWGVLDTKNNINYTSVLRSLGWVLTYSLFVVFAYFHMPIELYLLPLLLMNMLLFLFFKLKVNSLVKFKKRIMPIGRQEYFALFRRIFVQIIDNVKIQISATVLLSMDKVVVPYFLGYTQFAFYAVQSELATKTYIINSTWKRVLFPYLAQVQNRDKLEQFLRYGHYAFLSSFLIVLLIGMYGSEIIGFYAGEAYRNYGDVFGLLLIVFPLNILGTMGVLILQINGDFKLHHMIYYGSAIVNLIIFSILTYFFGIIGAAVGILISRTTDLFLYLIALQKYVNKISTMRVIMAIGFYFGLILSLVLQSVFFSFLFLGMIVALLFFLNIKMKIHK